MKKSIILGIVLASISVCYGGVSSDRYITSQSSQIILDKNCTLFSENSYFDVDRQRCSCNSGYAAIDDGEDKVCVTYDRYCTNYDPNSHYDRYTDLCACNYGYELKKGQCTIQEYRDIDISIFNNIPLWLKKYNNFQATYRVNTSGNDMTCKDSNQKIIFNMDKKNKIIFDCVNNNANFSPSILGTFPNEGIAGDKLEFSVLDILPDSIITLEINGNENVFDEYDISNENIDKLNITLDLPTKYILGKDEYDFIGNYVNINIYPIYESGFVMSKTTGNLKIYPLQQHHHETKNPNIGIKNQPKPRIIKNDNIDHQGIVNQYLNIYFQNIDKLNNSEKIKMLVRTSDKIDQLLQNQSLKEFHGTLKYIKQKIDEKIDNISS